MAQAEFMSHLIDADEAVSEKGYYVASLQAAVNIAQNLEIDRGHGVVEDIAEGGEPSPPEEEEEKRGEAARRGPRRRARPGASSGGASPLRCGEKEKEKKGFQGSGGATMGKFFKVLIKILYF